MQSAGRDADIMKATYHKYMLEFKRPSGTSRGIMTTKETWFIRLEKDQGYGVGECGIFRGLSVDDRSDYEDTLQWVCDNVHLGEENLYNRLKAFPSIQFGLEQAFRSLKSKTPFELFPSDFTRGDKAITINGLIWMGDESYMQEQIAQKLEDGFQCIKMKIGAIDFKKELGLLASIRKKYSKEHIELRVDANGALGPEDALKKLGMLAALDLHSIEQPIPPGNYRKMQELCAESPLPIALDEELIGTLDRAEKEALLKDIRPQYIILKPSLVGGFRGSGEWITLAGELGIGWWVTSALESNIGLNAIAQWTFQLKNPLPQGLGTGGLFTNNFECPLMVKDGKLHYDTEKKWEVNLT